MGFTHRDSLHHTVDDPNAVYMRAKERAVQEYLLANGNLWKEPYGEYYLAGPMTGIPQFNFPAFHSAARELRRDGYLILSPAEMDDDDEVAAVMASPDGNPSIHTSVRPRSHYLKRDFLIVTEVKDGVICLPGWERSSGARGETAIAHHLDKQVLGVYPEVEPLRWEDHPYMNTVGGGHFVG